MISFFHRATVLRTGRVKPIRKRWNGPGSLIDFDEEVGVDSFREKSLRGGGEVKGPAEKPLDQALRLVSYLTLPGQAVFDPCSSKGTTARACQLLGRGFLGAEVDPARHAQGQARLDSDLDERERERCVRFISEDRAKASKVPPPKDKSQERTYERAQRLLADVARVEACL
jgi:DNA modification methylase